MKKALLSVSFGTSYPDTRRKTIGAIEEDLQNSFPDRIFRRAWSSSFLRRKVKEREGVEIDSPAEALQHLAEAGVEDVLVANMHLMNGEENDALRSALLQEKDRFSRVSLARPLLANEDDIAAVAKVLADAFAFVAPTEMVALMGHGSEFPMENPYRTLQRSLDELVPGRFCVGTVEFDPGFAPVLEAAKCRRPAKIWLSPLMVVAGDHAVNDMAGADEDSWNSRLLAEGFETECLLQGLGQIPGIRKLYCLHAQEAEVL